MAAAHDYDLRFFGHDAHHKLGYYYCYYYYYYYYDKCKGWLPVHWKDSLVEGVGINALEITFVRLSADPARAVRWLLYASLTFMPA